jgi:predicted ATP-grasp superfamily ATP-dependent carboligase
VPSPVADWRVGNIQRQNTEREEEYIQAILKICEKESINVIFPSWEPKVYIFSKNKERFRERKILLPIPDYDALICAMDKYELIRKAEQLGFPCPKTFLFMNNCQLETIESQLKYPIIIKPRSSSGSRGLFLVRDRTELLERMAIAGTYQNTLILQEYVPGSQLKRFTSIWIVLDKNYRLIGSSLHTKLRTVFRDSSSQGTVWASFRDDELIDAAAKLCRALKLNGPINIQTKLDPRDGLHKLIEVNPRIGYNFWIPLALGLDTPVLALKIAKGADLQCVQSKQGRTVFISPVADMWACGVNLAELVATKFLRYRPIDPDNVAMRLSEIVKSYRDSYSAPEKVFDPFFANFFRDPLVSLTWWAAFGVFNLQRKLQTIPWRRRVRKPE